MSSFLLLIFTLGQINRVGVMSAMDVELNMLEANMDVKEIDTLAQRIFEVGTLEGMKCVCVKAGIGKVNAALTTEILIEKYNVDAVIFSGVAGGINPELNIGDIIISKKVFQHDFGKIMPSGFVPWDTVGFLADSFLIDIALKSAMEAKFSSVPEEIGKGKNYMPEVRIGCVVTGDQFIASEDRRRWIEDTFHADCVEMEGAAVAQVCSINKIPFVIIRTLSDLANENSDIDFESFATYASNNSSLIVKEMLKQLEKGNEK